ncbi:sensor histidine kinase [Streptomyces sp. NPDC050418]|uniref:sensor histidine kinase n=1 Tax=Streptomyces sp. NPDC050418 TaxID=3365612 RepID=UPI0037983F21
MNRALVTARLRDGRARLPDPVELLRRAPGPLALLRRRTGPQPGLSRGSQVFDLLLTAVVGITVLHWAVENGADLIRDSGEGIGPFGSFGPLSATGSLIAAVLLALLAHLPLALRRRHPLAVLWTVTAAAALTPADAQRLTFYAVAIAAYTAAVYSPYRVATLAALPVTVFVIGTDEQQRTMGQLAGPPVVPTQYVPLLILVPLVFAAHGLRTWKLRTAETQDRMAALEKEQAEALRRAAAQERARIARELHDVVTHNVSMMTIQAGAARKVMDRTPDQAREALLAVEAAGRAALTELRHTMGLLTMESEPGESAPGDGTPPELAPQPDLDRLDALVDRVRNSGVPVTLTTTGTPRDVPPGIGLAAYRVVQEALTNTVKHASGASARVTVAYDEEALRLEITDTGGTPAPSAASGNGHGLLGLRERLALYGGTLRAGRRLTGGYRVTAEVPLPQPATAVREAA